jgi:hypothetical protein
LTELRRSIYEYTEEEAANILNWQLNQLGPDYAEPILKYVSQLQAAKDLKVPYCETPPEIRLDFLEASTVRELINNYSLMPEENLITSNRPNEYRVSSLSIGNATRFRSRLM